MTLSDLLRKYKSFITYAFFGVCTTLVNILSYRLFFFALSVPNVPSTILAWLFAVLFAFITNKIWVFESKSWALSVTISELIKFFVCRIATGVAVDKMQWNALVWKVISNVIVIVLNYVASKLVIFVKKDK